MNRGIYPTLSGALVQEQRLRVIANNTANVNTTGFKREEALFSSLLARAGAPPHVLRSAETPLSSIRRTEPTAVPYVFARLRAVETDFSPGQLRKTQDPLHLAIQGPGFFEIKTPEGLRYTRNGMFRLDGKNRLVTQQGFPVMGTKGELSLPSGKISVSGNGTVEVENDQIGTIKVVEFGDPAALSKVGEALFAGGKPKSLENPALASGQLEDSNVNAMEEMVRLIEVSRLYESAQKVLQTFDHLADVAISQIGRSE